MMKAALISLLSAAALSGPAFSAEFSELARPVPAAAAAIPAVPPPDRASPGKCSPFLLAVSVGGVSEEVVIERRCGAQNEASWALSVERRGSRLAVKVLSDKFPAERAALEKRIMSMVVNGIGQAEADFIVGKTGPALERAAAASAAGQAAILAEASEALKNFLAR